MAREEADRDDLFAEVAALSPRIELEAGTAATRRVAGFRADGALSLYFGPDPALHFNAAGQLRRAFRDGQLYKAQQGRLVRLSRVRTPEAVVLQRHDLSDAEQTDFSNWLAAQLTQLAAELTNGEFRIRRQVPVDQDVIGRLRHWLARYATATPWAQAPGVRTVSPPDESDERYRQD